MENRKSYTVKIIQQVEYEYNVSAESAESAVDIAVEVFNDKQCPNKTVDDRILNVIAVEKQ